MRRCRKCVLPETFPGISFNEDGVCNHCQGAPSHGKFRERQWELRQEMERAIEERRGTGSYDCVVAFSGGKDSSYTLRLLIRDYGLHCLAITIDNGFVANQALKNARKVTEALGVDFQLYRPAPSFMNAMYTKSVGASVHTPSALTRASAMCNSCIGLINNYMVKTALEKDIPIVAGGYVGGQVPKDSAFLDLDVQVQAKARAATVQRYMTVFGQEAGKHFGIPDELLKAKPYRKISIINPMLTVAVSEDEILEAIGELGWVSPGNTGKNSTNCLLNDLAIHVHHRRFRFNPYVREIAEQVRFGLMSREKALAKVSAIPQESDVVVQAKRIGLALHDL